MYFISYYAFILSFHALDFFSFVWLQVGSQLDMALGLGLLGHSGLGHEGVSDRGCQIGLTVIQVFKGERNVRQLVAGEASLALLDDEVVLVNGFLLLLRNLFIFLLFHLLRI